MEPPYYGGFFCAYTIGWLAKVYINKGSLQLK